MTPEKLQKNLEKLRNSIVRKPREYTEEHAIRLSESFIKYTNTSTVNWFLSISELIQMYGWAFPIYITRIEDLNRRLGPLQFNLMVLRMKANKLLHPLHTIIKRTYSKPVARDEIHKFIDKWMISLFDKNKKKIFKSWKKSKLFSGRENIISQVEICYQKKLWVSCLSTAFPLLDHLIRIYFQTRNFEKDVSYMLSMFKKAGISSLDVKPGYIAENRVREMGEPNYSEALKRDLRLVGVALGSFLDNANIFYKFYRKDTVDGSNDDCLNRHALIHGAPANYNSKFHATNLLTFIDLTLELESVFQILLKED